MEQFDLLVSAGLGSSEVLPEGGRDLSAFGDCFASACGSADSFFFDRFGVLGRDEIGSAELEAPVDFVAFLCTVSTFSTFSSDSSTSSASSIIFCLLETLGEDEFGKSDATVLTLTRDAFGDKELSC